MKWRRNGLLIELVLVVLSSCSWPVVALIPRTNKPPHAAQEETTIDSPALVYKIVSASNVQYLPASHIKNFPQWTIQESTIVPIAVHEESSSAEKTEASSLISIQPTLNVLIQAGVPKYVMVGLVVRENGASKSLKDNYLAQQWTTFDRTGHANFRVEVLWGAGDGTNDVKVGTVDNTTVRQAVEQLGIALSTSSDDNLSTGFHIVSMSLKMETSETLKPKGDASTLTCLAFAEHTGHQILEMDKTQVETKAISKLRLDAAKVLSF